MKIKNVKSIVTFGHDKGGVGKSTSCINVAVELAKVYNLTVIDLDPKRQFTTFNQNRQNKINQYEVSNINSLVEFAKVYDGLIIIDLGGFDSDFFRTALLLSDLIIVPLSDSHNDLDGIKDFRKILDDVNLAKEKNKIKSDVRILVNRVHHANKSAHIGLSAYAKKYNFGIFKTVIRDSSIYKNMLFKGKSATELTSGTPGINVVSLCKEIKEIIGE